MVAIKKVLHDKRFKNRGLQIMRQLVKDKQLNIVSLRHCFYSQVLFFSFLDALFFYVCNIESGSSVVSNNAISMVIVKLGTRGMR